MVEVWLMYGRSMVEMMEQMRRRCGGDVLKNTFFNKYRLRYKIILYLCVVNDIINY